MTATFRTHSSEDQLCVCRACTKKIKKQVEHYVLDYKLGSIHFHKECFKELIREVMFMDSETQEARDYIIASAEKEWEDHNFNIICSKEFFVQKRLEQHEQKANRQAE